MSVFFMGCFLTPFTDKPLHPLVNVYWPLFLPNGEVMRSFCQKAKKERKKKRKDKNINIVYGIGLSVSKQFDPRVS